MYEIVLYCVLQHKRCILIIGNIYKSLMQEPVTDGVQNLAGEVA